MPGQCNAFFISSLSYATPVHCTLSRECCAPCIPQAVSNPLLQRVRTPRLVVVAVPAVQVRPPGTQRMPPPLWPAGIRVRRSPTPFWARIAKAALLWGRRVGRARAHRAVGVGERTCLVHDRCSRRRCRRRRSAVVRVRVRVGLCDGRQLALGMAMAGDSPLWPLVGDAL